MINLLSTVIPKSDQLNFDDFVGSATMTIKVTKVSKVTGDQPIVINYDGDNGKPYKPCKSMRRVLIHCWGEDGNKYPGRSMTLYGDPTVKFGGGEVGGIRISHVSDIDKDEMTMALTTTRASRKPYTVRRLKDVSINVDLGKGETRTITDKDTTKDLTKETTALAKEIEMVENAQELARVEKRAEELGKRLIDAKLPNWYDKIQTMIEAARAKFAVNPLMGS